MIVEAIKTVSPDRVVRVRIFIVEVHMVMRAQLVGWVNAQPNLACCGVAGEAPAALACLAATSPDLVLMNLSFHHPDELAALAQLRHAHPRLPILAISIHDAPACAGKALQAGASGYITKQHAVAHLLEAIATVLRGQTYTHAETRQHPDPVPCAETNNITRGRSA